MDDYEPQTEVHLLGDRSKGNGGTFAKLLFIWKYASFEEISNQEEFFIK
jgi:hypothetical protein